MAKINGPWPKWNGCVAEMEGAWPKSNLGVAKIEIGSVAKIQNLMIFWTLSWPKYMRGQNTPAFWQCVAKIH
jgi:hypothetical protein